MFNYARKYQLIQGVCV